MSAIDTRTQREFSIPELVLMENAGQRIWQALKDWAGWRLVDDARLVIVAGTGNNGGDALVIARAAWLEARFSTAVVLIRRPERGPAAVHAASCEALGIPITVYSEDPADAHALIGEADWVFDGLLGTGLSGPVRGSAAALIEEINTCDATVVAIDVPSGVGDEFARGFTAVQADLTVTVELPKRSLYLPRARPHCGEIVTVSIGFPPQLLRGVTGDVRLLRMSDLEALLPPVRPEAYKNSRGRLAVFAGAPGTAGALLLCAGAAARGRCGYVTAFVDEAIYPLLGASFPGLVVKPLSFLVDASAADGTAADGEHWAGVRERLERELAGYDGVLCGPGWGVSLEREVVLETLIDGGYSGVIDADGLRVLARLRATGRVKDLRGNWVVTPHPGEFNVLAEDDDDSSATLYTADRPVETVRRAAERLNAVVVLKAHVTYIGDPTDGGVYVVDGMNPALGTAGSGDVLAGVIAGLRAHGLPPAPAACLGVIIHQKAGARATREREWYAAEELLDYLGEACRAADTD